MNWIILYYNVNGSQIYATTGAGFHRSDDGGKHWRRLMVGLERSYTVPFVAAKSSARLYTAAAASPPPSWKKGANAAIYRSDDSGEHWVQLTQGLPTHFDDMVRAIALDNTGGVYIASGHRLFMSQDEGEQWQEIVSNLPTLNPPHT